LQCLIINGYASFLNDNIYLQMAMPIADILRPFRAWISVQIENISPSQALKGRKTLT
jgi:hypothetical protein